MGGSRFRSGGGGGGEVFKQASRNSPELVLILWGSIPCVFCLNIRY